MSTNIKFSEIKTLAGILYAQYVGSGKLLDGDTGNPSSLALILDLIHQRIVGYPFEWNFLKVKTSWPLTGARTYDLSVLFPDLLATFQIFGINSNQESVPIPDYDANVYPFYDSYQIYGDTLSFTGNVPLSGTVAYIQYKSMYMVRDENGVPKRYFENDTDYSVLKAGQDSVLTFGIGEFADWMADSKAKEQRQYVTDRFKETWNNLLLHNAQDSQVHNML